MDGESGENNPNLIDNLLMNLYTINGGSGWIPSDLLSKTGINAQFHSCNFQKAFRKRPGIIVLTVTQEAEKTHYTSNCMLDDTSLV